MIGNTFYRAVIIHDPTYFYFFSDEVFEDKEWHTYTLVDKFGHLSRHAIGIAEECT